MCGICGIYHFDTGRAVEPRLLQSMASTLDHRGPDDRDELLSDNLGIAHRRLSIIDLSSDARQPMSTGDGRYWIVYNGEVYNYLELRQELVGRGHTFRSYSDTEVILRLFVEEGPDCVHRLNGMYAFAIWDDQEKRLFAARDRFGIKPFYYCFSDNTFYFASEIKALLAIGALRPEIDRRGLADYLTFQFCIGDKTLFKSVSKLLPGHFMLVEADGSYTVQKYWELDFEIDTHHTEEYFEHQLLRLLEDSVRLRLRADVPVGAHLSGGLDSSTVVCVASSLLGAPIQTFSGGFREHPRYDETAYARLVADTTRSTYHEVYPDDDDFVEIMPRLIYHMDEPSAGPGLFPQFFVSELASRNVKVVLGGQGGDEIFGGYMRYLIAYLEECIRGGIDGTQTGESKYVVTFQSILPNLVQLAGYQPLMRYFWQDGLFDSQDKRYYRLVDRSRELRPYVAPDVFTDGQGYRPEDEFAELFNSGNVGSYINRMTRFDLNTLLPALLHVEDRTSMAVSLESRVPLLDHRIVELVASMPPAIKFQGGRSKHIFRRVVGHIVPEGILQREDKMGFPVPLTEWYGRSPVRDFVHDNLLSSQARSKDLLGIDGLATLLESEQVYGRSVWGLLSLELWLRTFFAGEPSRTAD